LLKHNTEKNKSTIAVNVSRTTKPALPERPKIVTFNEDCYNTI